MESLRTPDERFAGLPGYDFQPHYAEVPSGDGGTLRMHYVDEGPSEAHPALMLHGEPSWSFLYRKMIPIITGAGHRAVAPDLIGFGRSDKPAQREDYTYQRHVDWLLAFIEATNLRSITLVCHDWGGLLGLRLAAEHPERFARVVAANTMLPTGDDPPAEAFLGWQQFSQSVPDFDAGAILNMGTATELAPEVMDAYRAPFPDDTYLAGARQFPMLVPTRPDDPASPANRKAWKLLRTFEKPFLCAFSDSDPIMAGRDRLFMQHVPGAQGRPHTTIEGAGHFLQEDKGEDLARVIVDFIATTP
jgi:haloalkane dehalogenase